MLTEMRSEIQERLDAGYTLPAGWYSDSAILALERERIFKRTWQYACVLNQVREPGDYFATRAGHIPVVLVRDQDGALNGFVNVCRHRGHVVMQGAGHRETLQCPYHAWTYGLDGCLLKAPRSERESGFDADNYSLFPVQVGTWGPFVFVNADLEAASLEETIGVLPETVAETGIDLDGLRFHHRGEYVLEANWKIAVENYLECYHCPVAHPGFSTVIDVDPDAYALASSGYVSTQKGPVRASILEGKKAAPYDPTGDIKRNTSVFMFPNFTVDIIPGPPNMLGGSWIPIDERRTLGIYDYFFGEDIDPKTIDEMIAFNEQVGLEDNGLVESVHHGLESGMVEHGRLLPTSEHLIQHFQRLIYSYLA
jgi:phenylpropionate dioxygenase-like ring-hydroxylating dioxygenase large terminal subunit